MTDDILSLAEALTELRRLRARVTILEAELAVITGTPARTPTEDEPLVFVRSVPPSAPPHDEQP